MANLYSIHQAAKEGHVAWLKRASKKDLNKGDADGWTAVHWSAWNGSLASLQTILDRGGDANKVDDNGSTPLHIAATYGNLDSLELLIAHRANLFGLDNNGRTAARVAAYYQKANCCRYLDMLAMRWQAHNEDAVSKLQIKAMKDLKKRSKRMIEEGNFGGGKPKKISYDYATAPASTIPPPVFGEAKDRRVSASDELTRHGGSRGVAGGVAGVAGVAGGGGGGHRLSHEAALRQNFELRSGGSTGNSSNSLEKKEADNSAGNTFSNLPRNRTGPLLNSLAQLPMKYEEPEDGRHSVIDPYNVANQPVELRHKKKGLPELELTHGHPTVTLNQSALATFLHSLDLVDCVELLHKEKLDLNALSMCSEEDLVGIGLALGPRKKILNAVSRRKAIIAGTSTLTDTEF